MTDGLTTGVLPQFDSQDRRRCDEGEFVQGWIVAQATTVEGSTQGIQIVGARAAPRTPRAKARLLEYVHTEQSSLAGDECGKTNHSSVVRTRTSRLPPQGTPQTRATFCCLQQIESIPEECDDGKRVWPASRRCTRGEIGKEPSRGDLPPAGRRDLPRPCQERGGWARPNVSDRPRSCEDG